MNVISNCRSDSCQVLAIITTATICLSRSRCNVFSIKITKTLTTVAQKKFNIGKTIIDQSTVKVQGTVLRLVNCTKRNFLVKLCLKSHNESLYFSHEKQFLKLILFNNFYCLSSSAFQIWHQLLHPIIL